VITGHEHHPDSYTTQRSGGSVHFVAGQALFDNRARTNGFNIIAIDISQQHWTLQTLIWDGAAYTPVEGDCPANPFMRNKALTGQGFANNREFLEEITDIGTGFTHARKELRLNDLFVYPSLRHRSLQQKIEGVKVSPARVYAKEVPQFISDQSRLLILGSDRCGKTSLARTIYRLLQAECGLVPLLLRGTDFKSREQLPATLDAAYRRQYMPAMLDRYNQLPASRKAIVVDDFDAAQITRRALGLIVRQLGEWFGKVIIFADEHFEVDRIVTGPDSTLLLDYRQYCIEEFNRVQRSKLIKRWVSLGRPDCADDLFEREVDMREKIIDTLLGKQLLPAYPIIILAILQALEASRNVNAASGSYGELYEALITERLASISKKPTDLGTKYTLIARIAQFMYTNDTESLTSADVATICDEYLSEYHIRINPNRLIEDLLAAEIVYDNIGNYRFKYSYYYHFFVARYFRDNLPDASQSAFLRQQLEHMADRVYFDTYANILVFYLYLTKDTQIIDRLIDNAKTIYAEVEPANLETDVAFLNRLYVSSPKPVLLPDVDVEQNRDAVRQQMDDVDESIRAQDKTARGKVRYSADLDDFIKINIALKTLHILGQVLRNFPGSLRRNIKVCIAEQCYLLGLRVLGLILGSVESNADDLRRYFSLLIRHRQPSLTAELLSQSAEEAMIALAEFWTYGMIKTISSAIGMEDLSETYIEVVKRHEEKLSVQMIDATIKLDHFWVFPERHIDALHKRVHKNYVAFSVLRFLVANHLYVFRSSYTVRQKYSKLFNITMASTSLLEGGLSKSDDEDQG